MEARRKSEAMREVPLTKGKTALVSDEDYERVMQHSWCMHPQGYAKARINKKYVLMHRWIMGAKDGEELDHINGNKLDNRRENLRFCTHSQNQGNVQLLSSNGSGYKGVDWNKYHKKFRARCLVFLGYFDTPEDAARAYDEKAKIVFGEFARLNFPEASYA